MIRLFRGLLVFCVVALARAETHEAVKPRDDVPGVKNFAKISEILYRGEQPTAEGFGELKKLGVKTVVCLRAFHGDSDLLKGTGLRYVHLNCKAWHPEEEDVAAFLKILRAPENQPVFVHCMHGSDRTGMMVASYRMLEQKWTPEEATMELRNFGFHEMWDDILKFIKNFDAARMRKAIEKCKAPEIREIK
jgi:protein tyrosine/serine phosphatase